MFTDLTFSADVQDGKLTLSDEQSYRQQMRQFKNGKVTVRIEIDRGKRTNQANRYYRLVLGLVSDHTGDDPEDLHTLFKQRFLEPKTITVLGQDVTIWTTTDKDQQVFYDYVERIRRFALMELGVETPDPDPALRGKSRHAKRRAA